MLLKSRLTPFLPGDVLSSRWAFPLPIDGRGGLGGGGQGRDGLFARSAQHLPFILRSLTNGLVCGPRTGRRVDVDRYFLKIEAWRTGGTAVVGGMRSKC